MDTSDSAAPIEPAETSRAADLRWLAVIALSYAATLKLALLLPDAEGIMAAVWPTGGVALAALLLRPRRQHAAILATVFVTGFGMNLLSGRPAFASVGFMVANVLEPWGCAWLFARRCGHRPVTFARIDEVLVLAVGALGVNGLTALLGATAAFLTLSAPFHGFYLCWWVSNGLGILLVTPLIVACAQPWRQPSRDWRRHLEAAALGVVWCGFAWLAFHGTGSGGQVAPRPYWMCVPLVWGAMRFGTRVTAILLAVLAAMAVGITVSGRGGLPLGGANPVEHLQMVQLFLGVIVPTGLILAATVSERRRTEAKLQSALARLHEAQEMGNMGSFVNQVGLRRIASSPQLGKILGLDPARAQQPEAWAELLHPDDRAAVLAASFACMEHGTPFDLKYRIVRRSDGQTRWIRGIGRAEKNEAGKIVRFAGVNIDITEDQVLRQTLAETAAQFARTGAIARVGGWELDLRNGRRFWTVETCRLLDLDPPVTPTSEALFNFSFYAPEGRPIIEAALQTALERGSDYDVEVPMITAKGRRIWVREQAAVEMQDGKAARVVGVLQDITAQHAAERAVQESESQLAGILASTMDGILAIDRTGKVIRANQRMLDMWRIPAEVQASGDDAKLLEFACGQLRHPDAFLRKVQELYASTAESSDELELKDGRVFERASAPMMANGVMVGRVWSFRDITERVRLAQAVRDSEARLAATLGGISDLTFVMDGGGRFLTVHYPAGMPLLARPDHFIGRNYAEVLPPSVAAQMTAALQALAATGEAQHFDYSLVIDGRLLWWSAAVSRRADPDRQETGMVVVVRDITERKRIEEALRASEEKYRGIFDESISAIYLFDLGKHFRDSNQAGLDLLGYAREELLRLSIADVDADPVVVLPAHQQLAAGGRLINYEHRLRRKDGNVITVLNNSRPLTNAQGEIVGMLSTLTDITDRKQAEAAREKLEAINLRLQKSDSLGRMAEAIAHHFNNQLQALMMNLELAQEDLSHGEGATETLAAAMQSARKAAEVSTLMLTYLGKTDDRHESLDLAAICRRSLVLLRAAMPKDVVLQADLPATGPVISGSAHQFQQALTNLATNAWEASEGRSGEVRLKLGTTVAGRIPEENRFPLDWRPQAGAYAFLEVADGGCGVVAADIERIFDPFYSTKFTGRGLGLSIVLGIARAHAGAVSVESAPGRGSRFRVYFPISATVAEEKTAALTAAPDRQLAGRGTLLVVDDESTVRKAVALALRSQGFAVHAAADGVEAVEIFGQHRDTIDCVICDLTMPRMNGWDTLVALRQLTPGIPVILASGYSEARALEGEHAERPNHFLHKPYELKTLTEAISRVLPARGA